MQKSIKELERAMSAVFICIVLHIVIVEQFSPLVTWNGCMSLIHVNIRERESPYRNILTFSAFVQTKTKHGCMCGHVCGI